MNAAIETKKLTKYYLNGKVLGVKNLTLSVPAGSIFGFIGPNGAGKSTTIRLLLDLIRPTSGEAFIFGQNVHQNSVVLKKDIGYLPGEIYLPDNMLGADCLAFYQRFKNSVDKKYVKSLLDRFDLDLKKRVGDYSKGNKQKLAIILAMMHKPKMLLLDEPTAGLDPLNQRQFYNLLMDVKKFGTTTFLSTHILSEADKLCDDVAIIKNGTLLKVEHVDNIRSKNIRHVYVETTDIIKQTNLPKGIAIKIKKTDNGYHLVTTGKIGALLPVLCKHKINDVRIEEPTLEETFMHYYEE